MTSLITEREEPLNLGGLIALQNYGISNVLLRKSGAKPVVHLKESKEKSGSHANRSLIGRIKRKEKLLAKTTR